MTDKMFAAISAAATAIVLACVFLLGMKMGHYAGDIKVAKLETVQAQSSTRAAQADLADLKAAQRRGDELQRQLDLAEQTRLTQSLEHAREIKRLTHGRPCLNAGTVRLLNGSSGIQPAVPETASRPDAEDAPAATDTDIAEWADYAIRQYATCRDRLGALIDFETAEEEEK